MGDIIKNVLYGLFIFHFIGVGIYSSYAEWKYKNESSFVNSYLFASSVANAQALFWEFLLYKEIKDSNSDKSTSLKK